MNFRIPIYVEETRGEAGALNYLARPLFFPELERRNDRLNRALTRLAGDVRKKLTELATELDHSALARWSFSPALDEQWLETWLELKRGRARCRVLLVAFDALERRVAFTPSVPQLHFEVLRGQDFQERAAEVLTLHFRDEERDAESPLPAELGVNGKAWLTHLELSVTTPSEPRAKPKPLPFAFLGGGEVLSGAQELERVGRCLSFLYPDDLERAVLRDSLVSELHNLLSSKDRRPVLLVGRRQVGKTAIVHEVVWRMVEARKQKFAGRNNVWLLAPARLISGMSYVGQWENRLLAILKEAHERDHVLCFDDLPGLFFAGQSCGSNLNVADVLKARLEKRECRVVAEITPEAWRVIRERDRSFADLFHILPVAEPSESETLEILIATQRQLEEQHQCEFDISVLPLVCDLQRRYASDLAFPGKAAGFMRQLAIKFRERAVGREIVLQEFREKTGLHLGMLETRLRPRRDVVQRTLRAQIVGQAEAVEAMTDVVMLASAQLNDPSRPLASLLFLGPTGVGKTQCAKALAKLLFGEASRLVRFDMNEFLSPQSVARLVGTIHEPEGLLTSALRRQPFCVLLLDEVEKAHPDVFDLLLAVLGEGRLTDALGRTANFSNCIIILTSNLGACEARSQLGFHAGAGERPLAASSGEENETASQRRSASHSDASVYVSAAEKFFRPEFFNRLDRVVAFATLSRAEVERIALHVLGDVFQRDGLRQRQCALQIHPAALSLLVEHGYHPQLGARALKRAVERQLSQPLAAKLAELAPGTPMVITLFRRLGEIATHVEPLAMAEPRRLACVNLGAVDAAELVERLEAGVARLESELEAIAPAGRIALDAVSPEHARYFAAMEQLRLVRRLLQQATNAASRRTGAPLRTSRPRQSFRTLVRFDNSGLRQDQAAAESFRDSLRDLEITPHADGPTERLLDAAHELALAEVMAAAPAADSRVVLLLLMADPSHSWAISTKTRVALKEAFERFWGFEVNELKLGAPFEDFGPERAFALEIEGPGARLLADAEAGTHLFLPVVGNIVLTSAIALPLAANEPALDAVALLQKRARDWVDALAQGRANLADDPWPFRPITRITEEKGKTLDVRSGFAVSGEPNAEELRTFLLAQLPAPRELLTTA